MIASNRESSFLIKGYEKHQQSIEKSPAKSWNFLWSEIIQIPLFLGSLVRKNFDPTFVATLQGSSFNTRFQKGQIQESIQRLNFLRCLIACSVGVLLERATVKSSIFDLELEWTVRVGGEERGPYPNPSPYFWLSTAPLVQISFSPQPSAAIKIKDGGHNFR